jgi:hypothetical protein
VALDSWAPHPAPPAPASPAAPREAEPEAEADVEVEVAGAQGVLTVTAADGHVVRRRVSDGTREVDVLEEMPYIPYDPASGVAPRQIAITDKRAASRLPPGQLPSRLTGAASFVPLRHVDVSALAAKLVANPQIWDADVAARDNAVLAGRESNMARFKPGCSSAHLIFSDQNAEACFAFPWWEEWKPVVQPIISEILSWYNVPEGEREHRAVRLQLARMSPGGSILKHSDKGGWATGLHRIHIPVITNPDVHFLMQADGSGAFVPIHVAPGDVFEINNAIPHQARARVHSGVCVRWITALVHTSDALFLCLAPAQVHNSEHEERIHLLLDFAEEAMQCGALQKGQRCQYANQQGIKCL